MKKVEFESWRGFVVKITCNEEMSSEDAIFRAGYADCIAGKQLFNGETEEYPSSKPLEFEIAEGDKKEVTVKYFGKEPQKVILPF